MGYVDGQKKSGHKCPLFCIVYYESLLTCFKCLIEILDDVCHVFDAN